MIANYTTFFCRLQGVVKYGQEIQAETERGRERERKLGEAFLNK